jgi:hypothetical protein
MHDSSKVRLWLIEYEGEVPKGRRIVRRVLRKRRSATMRIVASEDVLG